MDMDTDITYTGTVSLTNYVLIQEWMMICLIF